MRKEYIYILIVYLVMQLSGIIAGPLVYKAGVAFGVEAQRMKALVPGVWIVISFSAALLIILFILRKTRHNRLERMEPLSVSLSVFWAVSGVFLAFAAQIVAVGVESLIGIKPGSENTKTIIKVIEMVPATMIAVGLIGPILEEIVFRKILFGSLYEKFSFSVSALISSLVFSLAHMDFEHVILYTAMGFTFSFLYVKTKRLIVPIFAHVSMNSLVVLMQYVLKDDIERMMRESGQLPSFINLLF
ncbi:CPBP family intramembrane glutamic endopeptidase [Bacillus xiapuensis]|uniref:CPBP family intramembrane glutamic endopeptidase n=1 Tax=Bacillus xiapuensis TaxID=2014075 RepID=UPI000C24E2C3|nr:type II CAAX endopeptidase family protein [Bacillus xiapuensis]